MRMSEDSRESTPNHGATDPDGADGGRVSRRKLMAAGAAGWASVSLSGCSAIRPDCEDEEDGGGGDDGEDGDDGGEGGDDGGEDGEGGDDTPTESGDGTSQPGDDVTVTTQTTTTESGGDGGGGGEVTTTSCEEQSVFAPGMDVGFLVSVYDNLTGDRIDDEEISDVILSFPFADLEPVELTPSGPHEKHVRDKWGGSASLPAEAEPGSYKYQIEVARGEDEEPKPVVTDELTLIDRYA